MNATSKVEPEPTDTAPMPPAPMPPSILNRQISSGRKIFPKNPQHRGQQADEDADNGGFDVGHWHSLRFQVRLALIVGERRQPGYFATSSGFRGRHQLLSPACATIGEVGWSKG
jgi:hypothetical protein